MVYITNFDEFYKASEVLVREDPMATRYLTKYRHCDGKLVLKVTNDKVCLKFKTDQQSDLKKLEKLNILLFTLMTKGPEATVDVEAQVEPQPAAQPAARKGRGRRG